MRQLPLVLLAAMGAAGCSAQEAPPAPRTDPWSDARARGIDFRAIGQEPGWLLEIDRQRMRLSYDYGEKEATAPLPAAAVSGGRTTYRAKTAAHELIVVIDVRDCQDVMSGQPFPAVVTVHIDGRELKGCGRLLGD